MPSGTLVYLSATVFLARSEAAHTLVHFWTPPQTLLLFVPLPRSTLFTSSTLYNYYFRTYRRRCQYRFHHVPCVCIQTSAIRGPDRYWKDGLRSTEADIGSFPGHLRSNVHQLLGTYYGQSDSGLKLFCLLWTITIKEVR